MEEVLIPLIVVPVIFIGLPWLIFHYITKWKQGKTLTIEDEGLLDDLHALARRLDERMHSIERIIAADNPDWRHEQRLLEREREAQDTIGRVDIGNRDKIHRL
jgi:phage shock protein B